MESSAERLFQPEVTPPRALWLASSTVDFDSFYRREYVHMVALARSICGSHELGEDLAQEALARAHRNWSKVSSYEKPGAWLRRVTINLAISRRRRLMHELKLLRSSREREDDPRFPGDDSTGEHEVWAAVRQLPPRQRAVVALFYQQDRSTSEIAEILECSVSTATSHLSAARKTLARILGEELGGEVS